jgi:hypothetical protein
MKKKPTSNKTIKFQEEQYFKQSEHKDKERRDLMDKLSKKKPVLRKKGTRRKP